MSRTFYFGNVTKRKNSTLQGSFSNAYNVLFKNPCSLDNPTMTLKYAGDFPYNGAKYTSGSDTYYYLVRDKQSLHNDLWEVSLELDPLATYKSDILSSTQFVAYSSSGTNWVADTRIPLLKNASVDSAASTLNFLFSAGGFYVLSVVGKDGCDLWACDISHLRALLNKINDWSDDLINDVMAGNYPWSSNPAAVYDFTTPELAIQSLAEMNMLTGFAGNAYSSAPQCIRSCIWVPFFPTPFTDTGGEIYLGQFATGVTSAFRCKSTPATNTASVTIPWQHNDWRRSVCEEVYLYLPLVGMINIPSDEIVNSSTINIQWSATATDGCIAYLLYTNDGQVIGTYGANAAVNFPLGISQQASAGEIVQTAFQGLQKTVSTGIQAFSSVNPAGIVAGAFGAKMGAIDTAYQTIDAALTRHNSCIGGIGGGAGVGLSLDALCYTVSHDTVIAPATMAATMGLPTQKPMSLNSLTGYCQCVNAHVALNADAPIINAVDYYLNSGFYIE